MIVDKNVSIPSIKVLSSLLKRGPDASRESLLKFLPESTLALVQTEKQHTDPLTDISLKELLSRIDDSWYLETLSKFSKEDLTFYLSLFSEKKRASLAGRFNLSSPFYSFSEELELYALNLLFNELFPNDLPLPLSYLPDFSLSF